ncbi:hypothetical protein M433DRAFT_318990 [Acidomyces richmondensis BFW]|nr:MAG: hypothetical protein FE78DRAFT_461119 [Acidomyces sp. 'richmondensis']KYG44154.1 hypothetical protein M433DRAFT_318990 [Acidomyces richmondensis BFW]
MFKRKTDALCPSRKRQRTTDEKLVNSANQLNSSSDFQIEVKTAAALTIEEFNACYNLVKTTSKEDYENSSIGWKPKAKKREMREDDMRYLLVRQRASLSPRDDPKMGEVEGFLSFMLTHDSLPLVAVLYVYEIHLAQPLRGLGLGLHLMKAAEDIARRAEMKKIMLTCFVGNEKALSFYKSQGYLKDATSPEDRTTRSSIVRADHIIMAKDALH